MKIEIRGLRELRERLDRLSVEEVMARALAEQAELLAQAVKDRLSNTPGSGGHDRPWLQTGALRDSIGAQSSGLEAAVGSSDRAAAPQEMGTSRLPPRPFLAPVAANMGESVAQAVGAAVSAALKGESIAAGAAVSSAPEVESIAGPVVLASGSSVGRGPSAHYTNPLGVFSPGSPMNEEWTHQTIQGLKALGNLLHSEGNGDDAKPQPELAKPGDATLPEDRRRYILDGDGQGRGGHGPGRTTANKSVFPNSWSDDEAIKAIVDVANDPSSPRAILPNGRTVVEGTRDGLDIRVIIGADRTTIINGYPVNVPRNGK